jgi:vacuolar-type H+-ATPase catalytic subunit A/Vma1
MIFPWKTVLQWVLPTIPEIISTVRTMKKEQYLPRQPSSTEDLLARMEKLEQAFELQTQIIEERAKQLQQLQTRLRITTVIGLLGLILGLLAFAFAVFH